LKDLAVTPYAENTKSYKESMEGRAGSIVHTHFTDLGFVVAVVKTFK
jgi:hypothetical protein